MREKLWNFERWLLYKANLFTLASIGVAFWLTLYSLCVGLGVGFFWLGRSLG